MKVFLRGLLVLAVVATAAADPPLAGLTVDLSFVSLVFHDEGWRPQRVSTPVGIGLRWDPAGWPIGLEGRLEREQAGGGDLLPLPVGETFLDLTMTKVGVGVFKARRSGTVRPYGGVGWNVTPR